MAKMTKAATIEQARKDARTDPAITNVTVEALDAMDYTGQFKAAQDIANDAARRIDSASTNYVREYAEAYVSAVQGAWGNLLKRREDARREWQRLLAAQTLDTATTKLRTLITAMMIRGARISDGYSGLSVNVERSFGASADLYVRIERADGLAAATISGRANPDDGSQRGGYYTVRCEINWSGTTRTIAESVTAVKLYSELIDAAAEIEAVMARERIRWTWGVPEVEATPEPTTDVFNAENA